ncbi:hypothetical protein GCM10011533_22860 [Streptosporangium jomthongense]|uniref:Uncharacterized protein n=1 Tax=Marinobacter aromaticivorans TaxID=1494078 RepID=A0ABW2IWP9_9GAMM|nr:hypothetical protein [Marinobacter aromaticivorans]GGE69893.1 hypothetical protein GCM10011533_22860 [Streptosporangium jomthongense]
MRLVSINRFINVVFEGDDQPPAPSTIRRHCSQFDENGAPKIPGACKIGKAWKIDIDTYIPEMERRMAARSDICDEDREFLKRFVKKEY